MVLETYAEAVDLSQTTSVSAWMSIRGYTGPPTGPPPGPPRHSKGALASAPRSNGRSPHHLPPAAPGAVTSHPGSYPPHHLPMPPAAPGSVASDPGHHPAHSNPLTGFVGYRNSAARQHLMWTSAVFMMRVFPARGPHPGRHGRATFARGQHPCDDTSWAPLCGARATKCVDVHAGSRNRERDGCVFLMLDAGLH